MTPGRPSDDAFVRLRRELHRTAELSGREEWTATLIREGLERLGPDEIVTGLGGHGVAATWRSGEPGPNVLLRCELDALPIADDPALPHASRTTGVAHKCGHDGHMATLVAVASRLAQRPPRAGSVTVLFQPAEETGEGGERVLADPAFARVRPDSAFALHNLPGFPLGSVVLRDGLFAFGSVGVEIRYTGAESHAAEPERGASPAAAVAATILEIERLASPAHLSPETGGLTVTHARVGEPAFGTSPGTGLVFATLRAASEPGLTALRGEVETAVAAVSERYGFPGAITWREPFPVTRGDAAAVARVEASARELGLEVVRPPTPFRWSEDFGHFTARFPGALVGLGAGEEHPPLHHPTYDFPDELVGIGADLLASVVRAVTSDPSVGAAPGGTP
jgi:amidohydrolase